MGAVGLVQAIVEPRGEQLPVRSGQAQHEQRGTGDVVGGVGERNDGG